MGFDLPQVLVIAAICYGIGIIWNVIFKSAKNEYIPAIVAVSGAILGAIGFYVIPNYPASDILTAIGIGMMSGLTATGVDQVVKQLSSKDDNQ